MKVDIEDVLFWMDAIRNSDDRYRTLESFWKGQIHSKIWLTDNLKQFTKNKESNIVIHGGWNGVLASLLFNSNIQINHITSIDIDPDCKETARTINKRYEMQGRFTAITEDMANYEYQITPDIVINTSLEHVNDSTIIQWKNKIPRDSLVVAQSNDYFTLEEHINCVESIQELNRKLQLNTLLQDSLRTQKYTRFMVIGYV